MIEDWLFSDERLDARARALSLLLHEFGSNLNSDGTPEHSPQNLYSAAHDWVSHGCTTGSVLDFYMTYYYDV